MTRWDRIKKKLNIDSIVDVSVDLFLILFDVLSSPILIVMRVIRYVVGKYMLDGVKNKIKNLLHWLEKKPRWVSFIVIPVLLYLSLIHI